MNVTIDGKQVYLYVLQHGRNERSTPRWFCHEQLMLPLAMFELVRAWMRSLAAEHDAQLERCNEFLKKTYDCRDIYELRARHIRTTADQERELEGHLPPSLLDAAMARSGFRELEAIGGCESFSDRNWSGKDHLPSDHLIEELVDRSWRYQ